MPEQMTTNEWLEIIRREKLTPLQTRLLAIVAGAGPVCSDVIAEYHRRSPEHVRHVIMSAVEWNALQSLVGLRLIVHTFNGYEVSTDAH